MANKVTKSSKFPPGTSVNAHLFAGAYPFIRNGQVPQNPVVETAVVAADGSLTFMSLAAGQFYAYTGISADEGRRVHGNAGGV